MRRTMLFPDFKGKTLTLSYDDGVEQDIRLIEIMKKNGLKGTFNINTECFAPEGTVYPEGTIHRRMTKKQAYELYAESGMEVAVHTCTHPHMEYNTFIENVREVAEDRKNIEEATGKICRGMAYPFGTTNDDVVEVLKTCGILYSRTTIASNRFNIPDDWLRLTPTCHHREPKLMELAQNFVNAKVTLVPYMFYLWGHAYEFEMNDNWDVIEKFAEFIGGHDDIWYATNIEIFEYIEAYKQLRTSYDSSVIYNPTSTKLFFIQDEKKYSIAPGETLKIK